MADNLATKGGDFEFHPCLMHLMPGRRVPCQLLQVSTKTFQEQCLRERNAVVWLATHMTYRADKPCRLATFVCFSEVCFAHGLLNGKAGGH